MGHTPWKHKSPAAIAKVTLKILAHDPAYKIRLNMRVADLYDVDPEILFLTQVVKFFVEIGK